MPDSYQNAQVVAVHHRPPTLSDNLDCCTHIELNRATDLHPEMDLNYHQ